jgi:hypothetical protein
VALDFHVRGPGFSPKHQTNKQKQLEKEERVAKEIPYVIRNKTRKKICGSYIDLGSASGPKLRVGIYNSYTPISCSFFILSQHFSWSHFFT